MDDAHIIDQVDRLLPEICKGLNAAVAADPEAAKCTFPQMKVMAFLYYHDRSTVGEVAAGVGVSMPAASELLDRLVEDGWIERAANPADRRQVLICLTPRARAFGNRLHVARREQIRSAMSRLDPAEHGALLRSIQALAEAFRPVPAARASHPAASAAHGDGGK
jgi:DNA-binding MarR family transcriptional regulator